MKKFLVILMVVAMASVLFVGCTTPPTPEPEPEPTPTPTPTVQTETPIISEINAGQFDFLSTATQYVNAFNVFAVAPSGSVLKLYINDVWVGTGSAGAAGVNTTAIAIAGDIADGVKTVYVTATQPGLAVSEKSTIYTVTLDTVAPKIASAIADSSANSITVTFNKAVDMSTTTLTNSALGAANWTVNSAVLVVDTDVIVKVTTTSVRITPNTPVATAGTAYYLEVVNIDDVNDNSSAVADVYSGITVP